jgi:CTD small phosphatase-like protein 2
LSKIGRDLSKTIIVDNCPNNFRFQLENGLYIKTWENDITDNQLNGLGILLCDLAKRELDDIRKIISIVHSQIDRKLIESSNDPYSFVKLEM